MLNELGGFDANPSEFWKALEYLKVVQLAQIQNISRSLEVLRKLPNFSLLLLPTTNPTCGEVAESSQCWMGAFS